MRIGLNSPQDVLALLVRRRWWVLGPFLALSCAVAVVTQALPKVFVSQSLILVRPRDLPQAFVIDLIGSTQERLKSIEKTVLSRTNLVAILNEFGDQLPEFRRFNVDEKVARLRKQINIQFQTDVNPATGQPTITYFTIAYGNQRPEVAQKIASRLTALFIQQDNSARESQINGTTDFLEDSLKAVETDLRASEGRLKGVKSSRQFELPDQLDANLRTLERKALDKKTNIESLDRNVTLRLDLEALIEDTPEYLDPKVAPLAATPNPVVRIPVVSPRVAEFLLAKADFEQVSAKYPKGWPDVGGAKARLERVQAGLSPEELASAGGPASVPGDPPVAGAVANIPTKIPNPRYETLLAQLSQAKNEFKVLEREKANIDEDIVKYSKRVENTPQTEQEISDLARQTSALQKQYDDLRGKLTQAQLSENMESQQKGTQFVTVDSANYPLEATKPDKIMVLLGGCLGSLAIAILLAVAVDVARQRVWTQSEVERFWGVPVLVEIPEIMIDSDVATMRKKKLTFALSSAGAVLLYGCFIYLMFLKSNFILRQLDPLLQKFLYK